jgi:hypothetical protein
VGVTATIFSRPLSAKSVTLAATKVDHTKKNPREPAERADVTGRRQRQASPKEDAVTDTPFPSTASYLRRRAAFYRSLAQRTPAAAMAHAFEAMADEYESDAGRLDPCSTDISQDDAHRHSG